VVQLTTTFTGRILERHRSAVERRIDERRTQNMPRVPPPLAEILTIDPVTPLATDRSEGWQRRALRATMIRETAHRTDRRRDAQGIVEQATSGQEATRDCRSDVSH
jgi:hypothetical protein